MANELRRLAEELLGEVFVALLAIADHHGITIKKMAELLPTAQMQSMRKQGKTQQDIMAVSGYALKTIRKLLSEEPLEDNYNRIERFVGDWMTDPKFPARLPLNGGKFPTFQDVVFCYGKEFTPGALKNILLDQGLIEIEGEQVTLKGRAVMPQSIPEKLKSARVSLRNFIGTIARNIIGLEPPVMEQRIWSYMIPPERLPSVRKKIAILSEEYQEKVIAVLAEAEDTENAEKFDSDQVVGLGIYWFERK